jgi:hypothetical protein
MLKNSRNKTRLILIVTVVFAMSALLGCGGKSSKKQEGDEETGSLMKQFTLMDEQGRRSGTLTIAPSGKAELKDANGETMATFSLSEGASAAPAEADVEKAEEKADEKAEEAKE